MTPGPFFTPRDWDRVELVAFDVDGTLYSQRALRPRMAFDLLREALQRRSFEVISLVGHYRRLREQLGEREAQGFEPLLLAETAHAAACTEPRVREVVEDWIERRPLRHLPRCRYPGIAELFGGLRRHGKTIGVVSDYLPRPSSRRSSSRPTSWSAPAMPGSAC